MFHTGTMGFLKIVVLLTQISVICGSLLEGKRNISSSLKCANYSSSIRHIEAVGQNDSIHYLLSTWNVPSGFVARTNSTTQVVINCDDFQKLNSTNKSINFSQPPLFFYGFSFNKLYEYNDMKDVADLTKLGNTTEWKVTDFSSTKLTWKTEYNDTDKTLKYKLSNSTTLKMQENGSLSLSFKFVAEDGEADLLPHLQYNANITQLHLVLDRLIPNYPKSRYVMEMNLVSADMNHSSVSSNLSVHKRLDDEHTPGVFQIIDWQTSDTAKGAFIQWKPVCYTYEPHTITNSTRVHQYAVKHSNLTSTFQLAHGYFGNNSGGVILKSTNVSFGLSSDKFYAKNNYTSWTVNIGYGVPPQEKVSLLIILIISVGMGIPVILIIAGGIGVCLKKKKQQEGQFTSSYSQIQ